MTPVAGARPGMEGWREHFIEEVGGLVLDPSTPRATARVLGWLVVCNPPEQSAPAVCSELLLSAGSVSAATRTLLGAGIIERVARPGDRHSYYRLGAAGWERALESRFRIVSQLREVAERALDLAGDEADSRLRAMRDTYAWFEPRLAELVETSRVHHAHGVGTAEASRQAIA
ncbi:MAG TPA: hypothetical protein VNG12_01550 [Acidimicrobiales bacterium]|nr:hypothetical protein [Acidimicrobiales bacterium]